jgi:hypothetical protein
MQGCLLGTLTDDTSWVVGLPVELSEEFRKRALECFRWAQTALTVRARTDWLNMAQFWHQLAQTTEKQRDGSKRPLGRDGAGHPSLR